MYKYIILVNNFETKIATNKYISAAYFDICNKLILVYSNLYKSQSDTYIVNV